MVMSLLGSLLPTLPWFATYSNRTSAPQEEGLEEAIKSGRRGDAAAEIHTTQKDGTPL